MECKLCGGKVKKREWTQPLGGGLCPKGTYKYYNCSNCGMRYTPQEVEGVKE